jgi:hypothetical protein
MRIERRHNLGKEQARERVQKLLDRWGDKGISHHWEDNVATIEGSVIGIKFGAKIIVEDEIVWCEGKDPPFFVRKRAIEYIERKMNESFGD